MLPLYSVIFLCTLTALPPTFFTPPLLVKLRYHGSKVNQLIASKCEDKKARFERAGQRQCLRTGVPRS